MQVQLAHPWFESALERLEVRLGNRLLAIEPSLDEAIALRGLVGNAGELTLVLPDILVGEQLAAKEWPRLHILAHETTGQETFGVFDSLLIAPMAGPLLPVERYAALARNNLRPGGRFLFDLPAEDMVPDIKAAWLELGWDEERMAPIRGTTDVALTDAARDEGLRGVQSALGSHLVRTSSAAELVAAFAEILSLQDHEITELGNEIVRHRKQAGPIEALMHRTQVGGQR
jgi:hypothetical protein